MTNQLRLYSGVVLMVFVIGHLANHGLGVISIAAMERGLPYTIGPWRSPPGTLLLCLALVGHVALTLWRLYRRRTLRMPVWQVTQLVLGLLIPTMLIGHVLATRGLHEVFGVEGGYALELFFLWSMFPWIGVEQVVLLLVVWVHACIGVHTWLRLKPWYARRQSIALALAVIWPTLALAGYVSAGLEARALGEEQAWVGQLMARSGVQPEMVDWVFGGIYIGLAVFGLLIGAIFGARRLRQWLRARAGGPRLHYPGFPPLEITPGATALEVIHRGRIPHASICGGRGRCSTCRVRVGAGAERLSPPQPDEQRVLERIGAPASIRLACQIHPTGDLEVTPMLPPTATAADGYARPGYLHGQERLVTVLFADMRGFTQLSDSKLPYDVVFLLNRYFDAIGKAVEESGGRLDKFIGDGVMALFGVTGETVQGCRQALAAARRMSANLEQLNETLRHDLDTPLRVAIGIHVGPAILGEVGYNRVKSVTAVGNTVNVASRLETLAKDFGAELVISEPVAETAGLDMDRFEAREVTVRGRAEPVRVRIVPSALALPDGDG